jgi:hypothetical protein
MRPVTRPGRYLPAVLAAFLLPGACGVPVDEKPRDLDRPRPASGSGAPPAPGFGSAIERLYFVRDGRLVRAVRPVPAPPTPPRMLDDLLAGPTRNEQQDGLTSALTTMPVTGMTVTRRRAVVTIAEPPDKSARTDETLAYGQIVCTLTSQGAEVGTVSFTSGGTPLGVPRGDGALSTEPLTIADYATLLDS